LVTIHRDWMDSATTRGIVAAATGTGNGKGKFGRPKSVLRRVGRDR